MCVLILNQTAQVLHNSRKQSFKCSQWWLQISHRFV